MSPEVWAAIFAGGGVVVSIIPAVVSYGASKARNDTKIDALTKRVDGHDIDLKSVNTLVRDVAVMAVQVDNIKHDVKNIELNVQTLTKMAIEDRAAHRSP